MSPQFKFKVAVEGLKGIRPSKEIAAEHQVSPAQVAMWKRELLRKGSSLFEGKNARN